MFEINNTRKKILQKYHQKYEFTVCFKVFRMLGSYTHKNHWPALQSKKAQVRSKRKKAQKLANANSLSFKIWLVSVMQHNH